VSGGLKYRNGKLINEGDIVRPLRKYKVTYPKGEVIFYRDGIYSYFKKLKSDVGKVI